MLKNTNCALCSNKTFNDKLLYSKNFDFNQLNKRLFSARRIPDKTHYQIVRCSGCGLTRSDPVLPPAKIAEFYRESKVNYQKETDCLRRTYGHYLKQKVLPLLEAKQKKSLLDIGCGSGFFLQEALKQGFKDAAGVEPGKKAVKQASDKLQKRIIADFFHSGLFAKNSFDVATCFHTLDHVSNPNQFLTDTASVLKPKGIAIFIVHDVDSWSAKLLGESSPIFDIEHIYLFNKQTLRKIFAKNGFEVVEIFEVKNTYSLKYWLAMSPIPAKTKLVSFLAKLQLANIPLTFPAGNIGIIAKK